ncbi:hypothetical protein TrVE_jg1677 [Triparma verrucosa]|uniref:Non-structural maintenance of chromosomes element 1 homolog n=1 Tax=Triparma verrucosa TaxID=1606542 RepID=A0A9W7FIJ0_9STRA|nr:hypothetical protein TrVE_jg1677 [Triparma verrucosa]
MPRSSKSRRTAAKESPSQENNQQQQDDANQDGGSSTSLTFGQKMLLQRITAAGSFSVDEMEEVYSSIKQSFGMGVPSGPEEELQSEIKKCVGRINALLSPAYFSISLHHNPPNSHYVFHNLVADAIAIKHGNNLTSEELGLFKAALESIVEAANASAARKDKEADGDVSPSSSPTAPTTSVGISKGKFISLRTSETATATVDIVLPPSSSPTPSTSSPKKAKPLPAVKAESLLTRLLHEKWLIETIGQKVDIGSRAWIEMGDIIRGMGAEGGGQVVTLR